MTSRGGLATKRGTFGNIRNTGPIETEEVKVGQSTSEQTIIKKGDITSVGGTANLNKLVVSGSATFNGSATFTGSPTDIQTENLVVKDPTIALGAIIGSGNAIADTDNIGHDRGLLFHYRHGNSIEKGFFGMRTNLTNYYLYKEVGTIHNNGTIDAQDTTLGNLTLGEIEATQITATGIIVNGNVTVSTGDYNFDIASHNGTTNYGLKLGGALVTSTAAELNFVDGSGAGSVVTSKAVIYGSGGEVRANTLEIENLGTASIATITFDGTNLTPNQDWKIDGGKVFKIGDNTVLSGDTLGSNVVNVGPLDQLTVDYLTLDSNIIQATSDHSLKIKSGSGEGIKFYIGDTTTDEAMIIKSNGNVGIGTTSPAKLLDVFNKVNALKPPEIQFEKYA